MMDHHHLQSYLPGPELPAPGPPPPEIPGPELPAPGPPDGPGPGLTVDGLDGLLVDGLDGLLVDGLDGLPVSIAVLLSVLPLLALVIFV
jgi:hypothetical protein